MPVFAGPCLLLCGCPFFCQIFTIPFLDTEIIFFLGKIAKNQEEKKIYGEITIKIKVFCEYLYINHEKTKRKTLF